MKRNLAIIIGVVCIAAAISVPIAYAWGGCCGGMFIRRNSPITHNFEWTVQSGNNTFINATATINAAVIECLNPQDQNPVSSGWRPKRKMISVTVPAEKDTNDQGNYTFRAAFDQEEIEEGAKCPNPKWELLSVIIMEVDLLLELEQVQLQGKSGKMKVTTRAEETYSCVYPGPFGPDIDVGVDYPYICDLES